MTAHSCFKLRWHAQFELSDTCVLYVLPPGAGNCSEYGQQLRASLELRCASTCVAGANGGNCSTAAAPASIQPHSDPGSLAILGSLLMQLPVRSFGNAVGCAPPHSL